MSQQLSSAPSATPIPTAALLWQRQPDLFEKLKRRLTSYSANTQHALAADWRRWQCWCAMHNRTAFPAAPGDLVDYVIAHSPRLERAADGGFALNLEAPAPVVRSANTVTRWLVSLAMLHRIADCCDPTRNEEVRTKKGSSFADWRGMATSVSIR